MAATHAAGHLAPKDYVLLPVLIFVAIFALFNAVALFILWFSHTILSSNRSTDSDFTDFYTGLDGKRKSHTASDQLDVRGKQQFLDQERISLRKLSGLYSARRSSVRLGIDSSSVSEIVLLTDSDEEFSMMMPEQALSGTAESRFGYRKTTLSTEAQTQPLLGISSLKALQTLEENETAEFCNLLTSLKTSKPAEPNFDTDPAAADELLETAPKAFYECLRYHSLVPIRRFDRDFLHSEFSRPAGSVMLSRAVSKFRSS